MALYALLREAGFTLTDYKKDDSDSMTDYYSPSDWYGVATLGRFVVGTDYSALGARWGQQQDGEAPERAIVRGMPKRASWWVAEKQPGGSLRLLRYGNGLYTRRDGDGDAYETRWKGAAHRVYAQMQSVMSAAGRRAPAADGTPSPLPPSDVTVTPGKGENVEIRFPAKPAEGTRARLKLAGFRWSGASGCWYGPAMQLPAVADVLGRGADALLAPAGSATP